MAGVQFRPGGAFPFFRVPASEVEGISVDPKELWKARTDEIRERLLAAKSVDAMLGVLERCLMEQLVGPLELHPAIAYAVQQFTGTAHMLRVAEIIHRTGLSSRRFIELFRRQVGLTPKIFCRVRRFQCVLQSVHRRKMSTGHRLRWNVVTMTGRISFTIFSHSQALHRERTLPHLRRI